MTTAAPAAPEAPTIDAEEPTHLDRALRRILDEGCPIDPQAAVAPFNSAF